MSEQPNPNARAVRSSGSGLRRAWAVALAVLCIACLAPAAHAVPDPRANFDHLTTGFELLGQHRDLPCESCHANAIFKGTPKDCGSCHGIGTAIRATAKPASHILSTDQCQGCHTPIGWKPALSLIDHTQVRGGCSTCHNGQTAQGKPPTHIQTDLECDVCHTTLTWGGAVFSHKGITGNCASCHNGVSAKGMPATHIPLVTTGVTTTPVPCESCHSNTDFVSFAGTVINHFGPGVPAMRCDTCHETAAFLGMHPTSASSKLGDSRPPASVDPNHPTTNDKRDCGVCHETASFASSAVKPPNHIPTTAPCVQCHTTPGNNAVYSVTGVHQGVTTCLQCHGPTVNASFLNVTMVTTPGDHIPIGNLDCNGSGCHTTANVNPGGFKLGNPSVTSPTLNVAGHATVAAAVPACQTCHETAPYRGMLPSTGSAGNDSRPTAFDASHPTTGDCGGSCHTTTPTFFSNVGAGGTKPANHIPTTAPCGQCHTTQGNYKAYSVTGTHQGVTACLSCHAPGAGPFDITIVSLPGNHIPVGGLDCGSSGCHSTANVNPGGFKIGAASITAPTLNAAGHVTAAGVVPNCSSCHENGTSFIGMLPTTSKASPGDTRPTLAMDALHTDQTGECGGAGGCHTTTPTFATDLLPTAGKPANHIPTSAPCGQCHTTPGDYTKYSVTGVHAGVTTCLNCHGSTVNTTFLNVTPVTTPGNHIPIGTLDCNGSGCHTTKNVNPGGFKLGVASITAPTLNAAGHVTAAGAVPNCTSCHESGTSFLGMLPTTSKTSPGDTRPTLAVDAAHSDQTSQCGGAGGCHTTTPTFATDLLPTAGKPAGHIPTSAPCGQCHTTTGDYSKYSVTGVHAGVTTCLNCHGSTVNTTFLNVTPVTTPGNHIPIGALDCNGSGCHTTANVNPGGFRLGTANVSVPTLNATGHATVAAAVAACTSCHETAPYLGMVASTGTTAGDSRPNATLDSFHPATGDCTSGGCHTTTPTFSSNVSGSASKPAGHIPTTAPCAQCHTTAGNYKTYSVTGTHQGVTACLSCHAPGAGPFLNVTIVSSPGNHIPIGTLDCNGSGCHTTTNVNAGGFKIGTANINAPTLNAAGHVTAAGGVPACLSCHESGTSYLGMLPTASKTAPGDTRPTLAIDPAHTAQAPADCGGTGGCHTTTPVFASNLLPTAGKPGGHIPTNAPCGQCHTTPGDYSKYSVTGVHAGLTTCANCHGPTVNTTFLNVTMVTTPGNHFPIGSLDCNGSGCHTTANVNPGGFKIGSPNINTPTLNVAGHMTIAAAVAGCQSCHETAPYVGMVASTGTTAGDSRPGATLDAFHPTTGDCNSGGCHSTTPTFGSNQSGTAKPSNHIPTTAPCAQCHTTAGNYAAYSVTGTHTGVTACLACHGAGVGPFANITIKGIGSTNHFPIGTLDCNGSGCHTTANVNPGGFKLGTANVNTPTLGVAGHTTVKSAVPACQTCHETAAYSGMVASTASTWGDSRPTAYDKAHPTSGDCGGTCHTTTAPTFATNQGSGAKPSNHIPTTAPCAQCHTTAGNYAAYSVTGTHTGVTSCLACHGAGVGPFANITIVGVGSTNHFPIGTLDCNGSGCHTISNVNPGGFKLGTASITAPTLSVTGHTTVKATEPACQTCHEAGKTYTGMVASTTTIVGDTRPTAYDKSHPTSGDCGGTCHTTTAPTFASNIGSGSKPANHIPTSGACSICHTTAGNYAAYTMGATGHAVTTPAGSGCATCHAYGLSFANISASSSPPLAAPLAGSTGHIPAVPPNGGSAIACELCHSPTVFTTFKGTLMKHSIVSTMKCMSCHEYGMRWQVSVSTCKTCTATQIWTRDGPDHHPGQDCNGSGCHSVPTSLKRQVRPAARQAATTQQAKPGTKGATATTVPQRGILGFLHGGPRGGLATGANGMEKPADHPLTSDNCQACHMPGVWLPLARVDHTQVRGTCASCHNGQIARAKPSSHLPTTAACDTCHTTNAWTPARFDHGAVAPHTCASCHNGVKAPGMPRAHVPTTQPCDTCHGTLAWRPAKVDHSRIVTGCTSCHNNTSAVGLSPGHLVTRRDCATCHAYPDWATVHFVHASAGYPGKHRATLACTACHTADTEQVPWPSAADAGTCGGCHAKDFKSAAHPKTAKGEFYSAHELQNCSGACHLYSDATRSVITRSLPGPYHRVTDANFKH